MTKWTITLLCSACLISGCAEVQVKHVDDKDTSEGVHFYQPRPYLLVSNQQKKDSSTNSVQNEFSSQIIWLPDHSRCYVVKIKPGWGTVDGSVKLQNGWMLDTLGSKMDSKIPETMTAVAGLVKEAAAAADQKPQGLYLIDIAPDGSVKLVKQAGW
jgi:hypothetical protein